MYLKKNRVRYTMSVLYTHTGKLWIRCGVLVIRGYSRCACVIDVEYVTSGFTVDIVVALNSKFENQVMRRVFFL